MKSIKFKWQLEELQQKKTVPKSIWTADAGSIRQIREASIH
jgi:hypothetical protein